MEILIGIVCLVIGLLIGYTFASSHKQSSSESYSEGQSEQESNNTPGATIPDSSISDDERQKEEEAIQGLKQVLLQLFDSLSTAMDELQEDSSKYEKDLEAQKNSLQQSLSLDDLKELGDELLTHVSNMHLSNTRYRRQLSAANELVKLQQQEMEELQIKAGTDFLTDTHNRSALDEHLRVMINICRRYGNIFSLLVLDIDHFKRINDTLGHSAGDSVLREVAGVLKSQTRESDFLARYGGEEFVYFLPEMTAQEALKMAEKLLKQIEEHEFTYNDEDISLTVSAGISEVIKDSDDRESIFRRADKALFNAKEGGRNRVEVE